MNCASCGLENSTDSKFCKNCGAKLDEITTPTADKQIDVRLAKALDLVKDNKLDAALHEIKAVLSVEPDNIAGLSLIAMIFEKMGDKDKALEINQRILKIKPEDASAQNKVDELKQEPPKQATVVIGEKKSAPLIPAIAISAGVFLVLTVIFLIAWLVVTLAESQKELAAALSRSQQNQQQTAHQSPVPYYPPPSNAQPPNNEQTNPVQTNTSPSQPNQQNTGGRSGNGSLKPLEITELPNPSSSSAPPPKANANDDGLVMPDNPPAKNTTPPSNPPANRSDDNKEPNKSDNNEKKSKPVYDISVTSGSGSNNSGGNTRPPTLSKEAEADALIQVGREAQISGNYQKAIAAYNKALPMTSKKGLVLQNLGTCYQNIGDKQKALSHFEQAVTAYEQQKSEGKDVAGATQGIQTCKLKIQALRAEAKR